jgi:hypothetical protein
MDDPKAAARKKWFGVVSVGKARYAGCLLLEGSRNVDEKLRLGRAEPKST